MLAEFAEWLETLPREKRVSIINKFVEVYATKPNEELIEALKRQTAMRDRKIGELNSYIQELEHNIKYPKLEKLYIAAMQCNEFKAIHRQIVGAYLYKNLATQNRMLRKKLKCQQNNISHLIYKLNAKKEMLDK